MKEMLEEIAAEIMAPTTSWTRELVDGPEEQADLFKGIGQEWTLQVIAAGPARLGTAVSKKRLVVMKLTDELAEVRREPSSRGAPVKRVYMPHAGHFIGAQDCSFHINTYVATGYIVSTVGEYRPSIVFDGPGAEGMRPRRDDDPPKGLGYPEAESMYETMVFKAKRAAVDYECCPYRMSDASGVDSERYATSHDAMLGHEAMCKKWERKKKLNLKVNAKEGDVKKTEQRRLIKSFLNGKTVRA